MTMLLRSIKTVGSIVTLVFLAGGLACVTAPDEPEFDNPLDPDTPDYIPPGTTIVTAPIGTVNQSSVTLSWQGSHELLDFSWRLDDRPWSQWGNDTSIVLEYMDEGDHVFEVKSRYATGDEETTPVRVEFTVDAVPDQSILLYPYRVVPVEGEPLAVELQAHGVTGLTALEVVLQYNTTALDPDTAQAGPFLARDGGTVVAFSDLGASWRVNVGVLQGPISGTAGSGAILTFRFDVLQEYDGTLTLSVVDARGPNDEEVEFAVVRGGVLEVGE
jgi:hypothetical protein